MFSEVCLPFILVSWFCMVLTTMSYFRCINLTGIQMQVTFDFDIKSSNKFWFYFPTLLANGLCWKKCISLYQINRDFLSSEIWEGFVNLKEPGTANYLFPWDSYFRQDVKVNPLWNFFPLTFLNSIQRLKRSSVIHFVWVVEEENF